MPNASYRIRDWNDAERSFRVVASTARPIRRFEWNPKTEKLEEYFESLEGWRLERFQKNPLILESHATYDLNAAIGIGSDIRETEDGGLEMKITLASAAANPRTAEIERKIKEGLVRGVSVGWEYGPRSDEQRDGRAVRVYRDNILQEISLCLVPADEDALIEAETDTENRARERVSNAGRLLASSRKRAARTDAGKDDVLRFDFVGSVGKFERTQVGGVRVPARLTRTGVLEYRRPDGSVRRELRLPSEVFNTDSLATLQGATVTDLEHHRGLLSTANWREATLGHAENVRKDGKYVEADLVINDARAIAELENGRLHDISCGYSCRLDFESGVHEGQPYDAIQRHIRYNHVAVLPKGKGRAGTDVALRLDAKDAVCVEAENKDEEPMAEKRIIRIDGKDIDYGSEQHIKLLEDAHLRDLEKAEAEKKELQTKLDKADGERKVAEKKSADLEEEKKGEAERANARMRKRLKLYRQALRTLAEDDEDEEKMDARLDAFDAKSDREIMIEVIHADARWKDEKFDGRGDEYVQAIYDSVVKTFQRADGVDSVVKTIERVKRLDHGDTDPSDEARAKMNKTMHDAWQQPLK